MKVPVLENPQHYRGLYVYDFGEWTAVGYTAEEIAVLLESETYRGGKVYRIQRASPAGQMELRGVSAERFRFESGMFFYRKQLGPARTDFEVMKTAARQRPAPCRTFLHLAQRPEAQDYTRFVTALIFPAEYEDEMGHWLLEIDYHGGDLAEGGISHVSNYYTEEKTVIERLQLWNQPATTSRCPAEVLANVRQAVQR